MLGGGKCAVMSRVYFFLPLLLGAGLILASCSSKLEENDKLPDGRLVASHANFLKRADYRNTADIWYSDARIERATKKNAKLVINLGFQRGHLLVDGKEAMDFPVCTGKDTHETPRGKFSIIEKKREYRSHSYGSVYDGDGNMVVADATPGTKVPKGGKYIGASMPLWMRLRGGYGMHIGRVYREAASHGCIRIPPEACTIVFDKCPVGTSVKIEE